MDEMAGVLGISGSTFRKYLNKKEQPVKKKADSSKKNIKHN